MNDWILYGVPGVAVVCLFLLFFLELRAGHSFRKAIKDTLGFGAHRLLRGMWHAIANWARAERKPLESWGCYEEAQKWLNVEHKGLERVKQCRG